jgi:hypothetical protein
MKRGFPLKIAIKINVVFGFSTFSITCDERRHPEGRPSGGLMPGSLFENTELPAVPRKGP